MCVTPGFTVLRTDGQHAVNRHSSVKTRTERGCPSMSTAHAHTRIIIVDDALLYIQNQRPSLNFPATYTKKIKYLQYKNAQDFIHVCGKLHYRPWILVGESCKKRFCFGNTKWFECVCLSSMCVCLRASIYLWPTRPDRYGRAAAIMEKVWSLCLSVWPKSLKAIECIVPFEFRT